MIILSQDKLSTTEDLSLKIECLEENKYSIYDKYLNWMGTYKTKERAQEVLQAIVNKYRQYNVDRNNGVTLIPKVYEMPKE